MDKDKKTVQFIYAMNKLRCFYVLFKEYFVGQCWHIDHVRYEYKETKIKIFCYYLINV